MKSEKTTQDKKEPTKSELQILHVLWKYGPGTVRFVNDTLSAKRDVQYTSTLKLMQIMHEKGILNRDDSSMKHIYSAAVEEENTKGYLLEKFVDTIYQGSVSSLMMQLLGNGKVTHQEMASIKKMIQEFDSE